MKFSCPLTCGLILSCICFRVTDSYEELSVNQSPSSIAVKEGDSAQITCCWSKIKYKVKVTWYNDETRLSDVKQKLQERETQNCSLLNFTNILKNATGHYICEVTQDIPVLIQKKGSGTALFVKDDQLETTTTTVIVHTLFNPSVVKPDVLDNPKRNPEDEKHNYLDHKGSSREVVIIYIFRSLPFICLLVAFFYLNRDDKRVTTSRSAVEHAVELGEGPDEDLEAGETQMNESEEMKQGEKVSEQEKERVSNENPEVTAATEEEKNEEKLTTVVVSIEQDASPDNEKKNKTEH